MSSFQDGRISWAERITLLLDELCELLYDYTYECATKTDIIKKETILYELVDEYIPRLLPDLDRFFEYIHDTIRNSIILDEREIEDFAITIKQHLHRMDDYVQNIFDYSDDRTKYDFAIASSAESERQRTEREYIYQMINSDQIYDDENHILAITQEARIASAKERKKDIINSIVYSISNRFTPVTIDWIHRTIPGATHQLISIFRKQSNIIDYKDSLLLCSNLQINKKNKDELKSAIDDTFLIDKIHTCEEIYHQLSKSLKSLLDTLYIHNSYGLFSVIKFLYPTDYIFVRPRIGLPGNVITKPVESITQFICSQYKTSIDELKEFIENSEYDLSVSLGLINKLPDVIMLDRKTIAAKSSLLLSDKQLQQIIDLIIEELRDLPSDTEALAIRDLTCITQFPIINFPMNEWVIYSILTKWNWPKKKSNLALYTFSTSPHLSRTIPIISTQQTIDKKTRQAIAARHEGKADASMTVDNLNNLDDLIEDEIEYDWDLEALEEEDEEI